jgi:hypothetical protein
MNREIEVVEDSWSVLTLMARAGCRREMSCRRDREGKRKDRRLNRHWSDVDCNRLRRRCATG